MNIFRVLSQPDQTFQYSLSRVSNAWKNAFRDRDHAEFRVWRRKFHAIIGGSTVLRRVLVTRSVELFAEFQGIWDAGGGTRRLDGEGSRSIASLMELGSRFHETLPRRVVRLEKERLDGPRGSVKFSNAVDKEPKNFIEFVGR